MIGCQGLIHYLVHDREFCSDCDEYIPEKE